MKSKLRDKVHTLLTLYPHLRDCDRRLCSNIWVRELEVLKMNYKTITAEQMLVVFNQGKLTSSDSITRARRQVQERYPEMRGEKYSKRQDNQKNVKRDLGY